MDDLKIRAPWTAPEVAALNRFQAAGKYHPFTCPHHGGDTALVAAAHGWECPAGCFDYTQDWAWAFMAESP